MELKKVTNQNLWDVVNLKVKSDQKEYVADNATSLLEAYATKNEGEKVETFAIYEKDNLVGFAMINFNVYHWEGAPKVARNNYCLWRFMIDQKYQDQGLGVDALAVLIKYIKTEMEINCIFLTSLQISLLNSYTKLLVLCLMVKKLKKKLF